MASDARDVAVQRLEAVLVEQDRLEERYRAAIGTSGEFGAFVRLQSAGDEVAAQDACVKQIDSDAGGAVWVHGREVGGTGSLFVGVED